MRVCLLCSALLYCAYAYYPTPNHQQQIFVDISESIFGGFQVVYV